MVSNTAWLAASAFGCGMTSKESHARVLYTARTRNVESAAIYRLTEMAKHREWKSSECHLLLCQGKEGMEE